jgi:hypothetical protein
MDAAGAEALRQYIAARNVEQVVDARRPTFTSETLTNLAGWFKVRDERELVYSTDPAPARRDESLD